MRKEIFNVVVPLILIASTCNAYEIVSTCPDATNSVRWSILICTLDARMQMFDHLLSKMKQQIALENLEHEVEIVYFKDNKEFSIGYKRNALIAQAKGAYVNFVDDDDDVHDHYVRMLYQALKSDPDCVSLQGIITWDGQYPTRFVHAL